MEKLQLMHTNDHRSYLRYPLDSKYPLEKIAMTWLLRKSNTFYLRWSVHTDGLEEYLIHDIGDAIPLYQFFTRKQSPHVIKQIIVQICEALLMIEDSILSQNNIIFDPHYILVRKNTDSNSPQKYRLAMCYLPLQKWQQNIDPHASKNELMNYLLKQLIQNHLFISKKDKMQLHTIMQKESTEIISYFRKKEQSQFDVAEVTKYKQLETPILLLLIQVLCFVILFFYQKFSNNQHIWIKNVVLVFLFVTALIQFRYLLDPRSKYFLFSKKELVKEDANGKGDHIKSKTTIQNLHPDPSSKIANLQLISGPIHANHSRSWQIYQYDFLIGNNPEKVNLCLDDLKHPQDSILRICQRAGVFYAQALSNTHIVRLEERILYRYEDYVLPDEASIRIANYHFRFRKQKD